MSFAMSLAGGKVPKLQELTVKPSQEYQEFYPPAGYDGFSYVGVDSERYKLRELRGGDANAVVTASTLTIDLRYSVKNIKGITSIYVCLNSGETASNSEVISLWFAPNLYNGSYAIFAGTSSGYKKAIKVFSSEVSDLLSVELVDESALPGCKTLVLTLNTTTFKFVPTHKYVVWVYGDGETHEE